MLSLEDNSVLFCKVLSNLETPIPVLSRISPQDSLESPEEITFIAKKSHRYMWICLYPELAIGTGRTWQLVGSDNQIYALFNAYDENTYICTHTHTYIHIYVFE